MPSSFVPTWIRLPNATLPSLRYSRRTILLRPTGLTKLAATWECETNISQTTSFSTCNAKEQRHAQKCLSRMINIDRGEQFGNGMIFLPHILQANVHNFHFYHINQE